MPSIDFARYPSSEQQPLQLEAAITTSNSDSSIGNMDEIDLLFDNMNAVVRTAALTEALRYLEVIDPKHDLRPFSIYDDPRAKCVMAAFFYRMMMESSSIAAIAQHSDGITDVFDLEGRLARELFRSVIVYRDRIASSLLHIQHNHPSSKSSNDPSGDCYQEEFPDR